MHTHSPGARVVPEQLLPQRSIRSVSNDLVHIPDATRLVHLQFRRFAGCPVCNLHLRSFVQRHDEISAASILEVVVFHSSAEEFRPYLGQFPFALIADPGKQLYREFAVQSAPRALFDPRGWPAIVRGVLRNLWAVLRGAEKMPPLNPEGGRFGLPADFLIASDGLVLAAHYGSHVYDQWSVDELLALASASSEPDGEREETA